MEDAFSQPVALITGGGRARIGNVVARDLADHGYRIALHYNASQRHAQATVEKLVSQGTDAIAVKADVAQEDQVERMAKKVAEHFGHIDVLVCTAAIWQRKRLLETTADDVRRHFDVNTLGTYLSALHVGKVMVNQPGGGCIITIGDWAVRRPYRDYAAYFPSKGAIPVLTRVLAVELAALNPNIRVNCIEPGPVMLPEDFLPAERQRVAELTLVKREGQPANIAQAVRFFIDNDFVTGTCLPVDGGRSIYGGDELPAT
jgi:pteridine reductase